MAYKAFTNPYFWLFFSGVFAGFALRYAVVIPRLSFDAVRDRRLRTALSPFLAAGAILLAAAGLLLPRWMPGGLDVLELYSERSARYLHLGYCFAGTAIISSLIARFLKPLGIPVLLLASLLLVFSYTGQSAWTEFNGEVRAVEIRILSETPGNSRSSYTVEIIQPDGSSEFITLGSDQLTFSGQILRTEDYLFLGPRTMYRIDQPGYMRRPVARDFKGWVDSIFVSLPWQRLALFAETLENPLSPATYALIIDGRGDTRLVPTYLLYRAARNST